jgi:hypothetical protein
MNYALLCKWGWKYWSSDFTGYWKELVSIKFTSFSITLCSPFWRDVLSTKHFLAIGASRSEGSGVSIKFWHDTWNENFFWFLPKLKMIELHWLRFIIQVI